MQYFSPSLPQDCLPSNLARGVLIASRATNTTSSHGRKSQVFVTQMSLKKNLPSFGYVKHKSLVYGELNLLPWQSKPHHMLRYLRSMINKFSSLGSILNMKVRSIHMCFRFQVSRTLILIQNSPLIQTCQKGVRFIVLLCMQRVSNFSKYLSSLTLKGHMLS